MIIYLELLLPTGYSDLPESTTGRRIALCSVLLRMGFTSALSVTRKAVSSYLTIPTLPVLPPNGDGYRRYISVALAWESPPPDVIRHPALRSSDFPHLGPFGIARCDHLCCSYDQHFTTERYKTQSSKIPPPINSLRIEFNGTSSGLIPRK